jgi:RNA 3'-terminal phosphate cyclase (ATP)
MMQTAIPCLLFANGPSELRLLGGTNTEFAPDIDYYEMVILNFFFFKKTSFK